MQKLREDRVLGSDVQAERGSRAQHWRFEEARGGQGLCRSDGVGSSSMEVLYVPQVAEARRREMSDDATLQGDEKTPRRESTGRSCAGEQEGEASHGK